MADDFRLTEWNSRKQIVWAEVPDGSFITQICGCVVVKKDRGREWNYPTFYAVRLCGDKYSCQLKHRVIGREVWGFYDEFKNIDMEATFGLSKEEVRAILEEWMVDLEPDSRLRSYIING